MYYYYSFNSYGYGTCFIGDFMEALPDSIQVDAGIQQQYVRKA